MKAESTFSLKDQLFNPEKVDWLADQISGVHPEFAAADFHRDVVGKFPELELKERIVHITECLEKYLPATWPKACGIILKSLPPETRKSRTTILETSFWHHSRTMSCETGVVKNI